MSQYHFAYYTMEDLNLAEIKTRGIIGHNDIVHLIEQMKLSKKTEIEWFKLSETLRDLINCYCAICPKFYPEIKILMLKDYDPKKAGWPFQEPVGTKLESGKEYYARSNPLGAISALSSSGLFVGVKPDEFKFIRAPDWVLQKHGICPVCFRKGEL